MDLHAQTACPDPAPSHTAWHIEVRRRKAPSSWTSRRSFTSIHFVPRSEYAIPTTLRVTGNGVKVGAITYPPGENRKFQFSEEPINVYEGRCFSGSQ